MGAEAKRYLQDHCIPQLFEGLMTGLIHHKPEDPAQFLEHAIRRVRHNPGMPLKWDSFVTPPLATEQPEDADEARPRVSGAAVPSSASSSATTKQSHRNAQQQRDSSQPSRNSSGPQQNGGGIRSRQGSWNSSRPGSLARAAQNAFIPPDAPIILFMGGPGGGKTRYASQLQHALREEGLVHICMPDLVRTAIARYKDRSPEWRVAAERYQRGELIPNELAQQLVKAEMGRHPQAKAYFLEGFPREAQQVEDFERNVRPVDMALILDYDEEVLRRHMQSRGLLPEVIDRRIDEFKQKTLPSAKYFDDQRLLHLIPGEKEDAVIVERMRKLVMRALRSGVGGRMTATTSASSSETRNGQQQAEAEAGEAGSPENVAPIGENGTADHEATSFAQEQQQEQEPPTPPPPPPPPPIPPSAEESAVPRPPSSSAKAMSAVSASSRAGSRPPTRPQTMSSATKKTAGAGRAPSAGGAGGTATTPTSRSGTPKAAKAAAPRQSASSTASTPKPGDGAFRELSMANGTRRPSAPKSNGILNGTAGTSRSAAAAADDAFAKEVPVVLIIGAPGSSKSRFAQRIAKKFDGFVFISLGEMLRRKVLQNGEDELWTRIGRKMDAGEMIPMRICRELLYTAVQERAATSWGFVIEGYPRTLAQAEDIEAQLRRVDLAILIDCTEQFCKDALRKRYQRDKEEGAERADDEESIVRLRLAQFKTNTLPMLKHLDDQGKLRVVRLRGPPVVVREMLKIEGDTNEEKVFQEMCTVIENTLYIQDDGQNGKSLGSSKQGSVDEQSK